MELRETQKENLLDSIKTPKKESKKAMNSDTKKSRNKSED